MRRAGVFFASLHFFRVFCKAAGCWRGPRGGSGGWPLGEDTRGCWRGTAPRLAAGQSKASRQAVGSPRLSLALWSGPSARVRPARPSAPGPPRQARLWLIQGQAVGDPRARLWMIQGQAINAVGDTLWVAQGKPVTVQDLTHTQALGSPTAYPLDDPQPRPWITHSLALGSPTA